MYSLAFEMPRWKCGRCGETYTTTEFMTLEMIKAVADDPDPMKNYGFTSVCGCGYVFHNDKWLQVTEGVLMHHMTAFHWIFNKISLGRLCKPHKITIKFSTVFLEMNHGWTPENPLWYETMAFPEKEKGCEINCGYQARYETKEQAEKGHEVLLRLFEGGKWIIKYYLPSDWQDLEWRLDFSDKNRRILPNVSLYSAKPKEGVDKPRGKVND